jgi:hypothetical protein
MLEAVKKMNPSFYPVPLQPPKVLANGVKQFEAVGKAI